MNQTQILLANARNDYSQALNVLCLVQMHMVPVTIEDTMYAYMVAKDWCEWIKKPNFSVENPLPAKTEDCMPMLDMFQRYADNLAKDLKQQKDIVEAVFETLNPNLAQLLQNRDIAVKEATQMYFRSLCFTARLFEEKFSDNRFNEILKEKQIPPMS